MVVLHPPTLLSIFNLSGEIRMNDPKLKLLNADAPRPEIRIDRREVLRMLVGGVLALSSASILAGCGGGGGGDASGGGGTPPGGGPTAFTVTQPVTSAGGLVTDPTSKISIVIPANSLTAPSNVQLLVGTSQRANVVPPKYAGNPNSVDVALDPAALAAGQSFQIQIPAPGPYDAFGTMMIATNDKGALISLPLTYDAGSNMLTGSMTTEQFHSLASPATGHLVTEHAVAMSHPHSLGDLIHSVGIFAVTVSRIAGPADGTFFVYRSSSKSFESLNGDSMNGLRVAVVVHGIFSKHSDMNALGEMLQNEVGNSYDAVWCYEYNFGAQIADNGHVFAQKLTAQIAAGAQSIDIVAHSMGGLVSRWALEQEGLGTFIKRLITLDTPHEGTPVLALQLLVYAISVVPGVDIAGLIPGINDLGAPVVIAGLTLPSFLTTLNAGDSPYKSTADYYTSAGTEFSDYVSLGIPTGQILNNVLAGGANDGIVPQYSALSPVLSSKSASWAQHPDTHTAIKPLNHHQIGIPDPGNQDLVLQMLRAWLVTTQGVIIQ